MIMRAMMCVIEYYIIWTRRDVGFLLYYFVSSNRLTPAPPPPPRRPSSYSGSRGHKRKMHFKGVFSCYWILLSAVILLLL